ncbi:unnamed protein product [Fraxinus pennsylvanica]|uniref:Uncharacterized protein n=1 Tax=Fraxinus pennsylvanica TaxID=56036 RepID=A0AAD1Z8N0_9LAMI|nr:unnamed protein product [Fraxinus pennsylvanica]
MPLQKENSAELSSKLAELGLAAVLAYGIIGVTVTVTYTSFFVLAFLGYEKSNGKNPAANLQALLGILILMWTGNNITRPFRVAGAAALASAIDKGLRSILFQLSDSCLCIFTCGGHSYRIMLDSCQIAYSV